MRLDFKKREIFDLKMDAAEFAAALELHCNWFTAVPDSVFKGVFPKLSNLYFATRENHAVAMAFGARLGGLTQVVLMQNSGLGLCLDALLGTFKLYNQGLLLIVSNRGVLEWEEIQHQEWGRVTAPLLSAMGIVSISFDKEGWNGLRRAIELVKNGNIVVLLVERGNINEETN